MKTIEEKGMGWYKVQTHRNFQEKAAKNWLLNNFSTKKATKSLIAQHYSVSAAKHIVSSIVSAADTKYRVLTSKGYMLVRI